jgi:cytochrome c biogenesis protein CcmG/thiol:disulfide interchange protein DsbE
MKMEHAVSHNPVNSPVAQQSDQKLGWKRWIVYTFLGGLILFMILGLISAYKEPLSEGLAPDFTLETFAGETITLSQFRGQVVIINFWASWCDPCREEAAYLEETWRKYRDQGVIFIGVDYVDTERQALAYIEEFDITYYNGPDLGTRISDAYQIQGVPETFYVAKSGELRGMKIGALVVPELDEKIEELLAEEFQPY